MQPFSESVLAASRFIFDATSIVFEVGIAPSHRAFINDARCVADAITTQETVRIIIDIK